jgi:glycosyltransferase XagB
LTAQVYQFVSRREELADHSSFEDGEPLPLISLDLVESLFDRLSAADKKNALQRKIVPVAILPKLTLYAAVGQVARENAQSQGLRVIADIAPADFRIAVRRNLGAETLANATYQLRRHWPQASAYRRVTAAQIFWVSVLTPVFIYFLALLPADIRMALASTAFGVSFLAIISLRVLAVFATPISKQNRFAALEDNALPVYTVLVPVFRETSVLTQLIFALSRLNYPTDKLDIKIILEEMDIEMQRAVAALNLPVHFDIIVVPPGKPQTKPRALNYALQFARGSLLTIYDAEDIPEPMQLRKSADQFRASAPKLACLQAELAFYNPNENWLTRQFTLEYATLFCLLLPALAQEKLPILLGGTSNHFRTSILRDIGGWDPYNVTEDADLGIRLARLGYSTSIVDSTTYEEANSQLGNWLQQRARWLKGYLQTWLVHMRNPIQSLQEFGHYGWWSIQAMTAGIFFSALLHPIFLAHAIYTVANSKLYDLELSYFMAAVVGINIVVLCAGYGFSIYAAAKAMRLKNIRFGVFDLASIPVYWLLISIAGWMALWQFFVKPHHWNKTRHGLSKFQNK